MLRIMLIVVLSMQSYCFSFEYNRLDDLFNYYIHYLKLFNENGRQHVLMLPAIVS